MSLSDTVYLLHIYTTSDLSGTFVFIHVLLHRVYGYEGWGRCDGRKRVGRGPWSTPQRMLSNYFLLFWVRTEYLPRRTIRPWWVFTCWYRDVDERLCRDFPSPFLIRSVTLLKVHHVDQYVKITFPFTNIHNNMWLSIRHRLPNHPRSPWTSLVLIFWPLFM